MTRMPVVTGSAIITVCEIGSSRESENAFRIYGTKMPSSSPHCRNTSAPGYGRICFTQDQGRFESGLVQEGNRCQVAGAYRCPWYGRQFTRSLFYPDKRDRSVGNGPDDLNTPGIVLRSHGSLMHFSPAPRRLCLPFPDAAKRKNPQGLNRTEPRGDHSSEGDSSKSTQRSLGGTQKPV